jgi:hypothetical protein
MHRVLFPDFVELDTDGGKDLSNLFLKKMVPNSSGVQSGPECVHSCESVFSKHRIRKIELAAQDNQSSTSTGSQSSSKQLLLNSEVSLLQATIQNQEMLLSNARQEMHELRLKMQQQSAENRSLKNQLIEMREAAAMIAEQHATETQNYLAKVMDAEEKTLHAASAIDLATNVHKAAISAQRAVSSVRFENLAFKRDKDRLIHLLSMFEPAKALALQLQQIPSNYFPLPGIGTTAISAITKAQLNSTSSFVNPLISKKIAAEGSFWMSSNIASVVLGWGDENSIEEITLVPLLEQLNKLWTDATKRAQELASVSRLKKNRTASEPNERRNCATPNKGKKCRKKVQRNPNILYPSTLTEAASDSVKSLNSLGKLLGSGVSRLRMKSQMEEEESVALDSKTKHYPDLRHVHTPQTVNDHHLVSPNAIRSLYKSEEQSRELHEILPLELLESLKQEMMVLGDLSAGNRSPISPHAIYPKTPLEKSELVLRNTSFRISLIQ